MNDYYIYHRKSGDFVGDTIYPLNHLPFPDIKTRELKKYQGRETLLEVNIPPLSCLWNDVIHCSPVHPNEVYSALHEAGFEPPEGSYFAIPASLLPPTQTTIFLSSVQSQNRYAAENYLQFLTENLQLHQHLPEATKVYYATCKSEGRNPLLYVGVPHILYLGNILINDCEVIEVF
jgi:hypothetical protein